MSTATPMTPEEAAEIEIMPGYTQPAYEVASEALEETKILHDHPDMAGYRTGIRSLDEKAGVAFTSGQLIVVVAESGRGKTAFVGQLAVSMASQCWVQVFSLEDSARAMVKRSLSMISRINVGEIRKGFPAARGIPTAFHKAVDVFNQLDLGYVDRINPTVLDVMTIMWRHAKDRNFAPGVVVIDQLSMINPPPRGGDAGADFLRRCTNNGIPAPTFDTDAALQQWTAKVLRLFAERYNIMMILVCQLNENHAPDTEPTIRSVRASRGITHEAALVLCPWIPQNITVPPAERGPGEPAVRENTSNEGFILALKGRNVQAFKVATRFLGEYQCFVEPRDASAPFSLPEPRSAAAKAGMDKLMALVAQYDTLHEERIAGLAELPPARAPKQLTIDELAEQGEVA